MNRTILIRIILGSLSALAVLVAVLFVFVKGEPDLKGREFAALLKREIAAFAFAEARSPGPKTSFLGLEGQKGNLDDYRGKVILLNLWATWCTPCLHEMPTLDRLKADMASDEFDVLAVSVDRAGLEKSRDFLERTGAKHLKLWVDETMELNYAYSAYQLPTTILIGRDGREIGRQVGDTEWDSPEVKRFLEAVIEATRPASDDQGSSGLSQ